MPFALSRVLAVLWVAAAAVGPSHASDALMAQADAAFRKGSFAEAAALTESACRDFEAGLGERDRKTLRCLNSLAFAYGALGRHEEALALGEKVTRLYTDVLGEKHPDTLSAMSGVAWTLGRMGRHAQQAALNEKVLHLRTATLGERHRATLQSMNNLARAYSALGRHGEELALNEKVLRLSTEVLGERHVDTLTSMNNLSLTYGSVGRRQEQVTLGEHVLRLRTEILGERHPNTLTSMNNLADAYGALGRRVEQLALAEKVLRLRTEVLGERHPATLEAMNNLATTYGALGRHGEQLVLNEKVLRAFTEILGERHPSTLTSMGNLAGTYLALGRQDDQLALREKELRLRSETLGERHPHTLQATNHLARALARQRRLADAAALADRYVAGAEWQRSQPGLSPENRQSLFQFHARNYAFFGVATALAGNVSQALRLAELSKARTLLEGMAAQRAARGGVLPPAEQARLDDLNREAGALEQRLAQAQGAEARQRLEASRNDVVRQYEALQDRLKRQYPKFAQLSDVHIVEAADLPGLVPGDAVAVSYLVTDNDLAAFTIDSEGRVRFQLLGTMPNLADAVEIVRQARSARTPIGQVLAEQDLKAWKLVDGSWRLLGAAQSPPSGATPLVDAEEVARYLATRLLQPLARELQTRKHWILSPDGPLAQLPFESLPFGERAEPAVTSADIHYTQSLSVYAMGRRLQQAYGSLERRQALFAMGNPEYSPREISARERRSLQRDRAPRSSNRLVELDALWSPLPGTETEVKAVAELFPGSSTVLLGARATEQQLQAFNDQGRLQDYRYLLFSAHGYLSPDEPALSSIVLGLTRRTPEADGYVTAAEWPGYDLRSDLAMLSACDSGVGKVVRGEGVMGLPFALFVAGNVNTVLTLWPVDDGATAEFVRRFFARLAAGLPATRALAETKREFMRSERYGHPRFWAPFVLVGAG